MFDIKTRGLDALERITGSLRSLAVEQPAIDAATYERYFLAQLSKPELALDVFLPLVVHAACEMSPSIDSYIVSRDVPAISNGTVQMEHKWPSYDLGLYTLALYRGITAKLPSYLGHLTAFLRFIALLYCAQLALNQHPLYTMDSGEYEPNVHTSTHFLTTPRQSPAEVEGLMKQELINLDPFTAWCRVQNLAAPPGEKIRKYKIEIPNPQPLVTGKALTQRIEAVRQQSRRLIAPRPASVVAADIRGRVALLRQPAAPHARAADALPGAQIPPVPEEGKQPPKRPRMGEA